MKGKGDDRRWGETGGADLLASCSFKWRKTESVDCQEKCSRQIFNSSKHPWRFNELNIFHKNVLNTHQTLFSSILNFSSTRYLWQRSVCLLSTFTEYCVVVNMTNFQRSIIYQTSAATYMFLGAFLPLWQYKAGCPCELFVWNHTKNKLKSVWIHLLKQSS